MKDSIVKKRGRVYIVDYLKAICAIMVIITHYSWTHTDKLNPLFPFAINMAVPIFMILSGYTFVLSAMKKNSNTLKSEYRLKLLIPKIIRFTVPVVVAFVIYVVVKTMKGSDYTIHTLQRKIIMGKYGPGSYYYGLMLQLLILFPLIYYVVKKFKALGVVFVGTVNLTFEIMIHSMDVDIAIYRILIFRYLLFIAMGCYLYLHKKRLNAIVLLGMFCIGCSYLISYKYMGYDLKLFTYWSWSSMVTAFYIFPIIHLLFYYGEEFHLKGKLGNLLSLMGAASYHIFLTQMVYYGAGANKYLKAIPTYEVLTMNILICVSVGIVFFKIESRVTTVLIRKCRDIKIYLANVLFPKDNRLGA